jgi:hypothetical protein
MIAAFLEQMNGVFRTKDCKCEPCGHPDFTVNHHCRNSYYQRQQKVAQVFLALITDHTTANEIDTQQASTVFVSKTDKKCQIFAHH